MRSALTSLEDRYAKLRQASDTVSKRLDGTIGRISEIVAD